MTLDDGSDAEVIKILSSSDEKAAQGPEPSKKTKVVKAYHVNPPLDLPLKPGARAGVATAAFNTLTTMFDPVKL
jgi:hypothetical protein